MNIQLFPILSLLFFLSKSCAVKLEKTNLLFITFDDLRPDLSIYGREFMITPNFERLARHSVTFDYSMCQVAVCNPSRDSLMTGLRPDTTGTVNFENSFNGVDSLPSLLVKNGYNTAASGKIFHWDHQDHNKWTHGVYLNNWYEYQSRENNFMNSSTMPDKVKKIEDFRDYDYVEHALQKFDQLIKLPNPFMLGMGFKLPHLAVHLPYKYYEMYKDPARMEKWKLSKHELRFPSSANEISYRCCADHSFKFMNEEGALRFNHSVKIGKVNEPFLQKMHDEMMQGYAGSITFLDDLLGKLLDYMDAHDLWKNTTVVLTSDHGMHNGEKGIWEKWTLFEESSRVPLLISHPHSPFKGKRYPYPVESIDIFATLDEILGLTRRHVDFAGDRPLLQGKSLAPVIFGDALYNKLFHSTSLLKSIFSTKIFSTYSVSENFVPITVEPISQDGLKGSPPIEVKLSYKNHMPIMKNQVAITQAIRCADKRLANPIPMALRLKRDEDYLATGFHKRTSPWRDCSVKKHTYDEKIPTIKQLVHNPFFDIENGIKVNLTSIQNYKDEYVLMGYSMRTSEFRYTCYFHFDRNTRTPLLNYPPFEEELYDHRNETLADFTKREIINLAIFPQFKTQCLKLRRQLLSILHKGNFRY